LPVLHTVRGERHYTALYSNTPRARRMGASRDWVVLYYDSGQAEGQATVITARWGPLAGTRIVRGGEVELAQGPSARFSSRAMTMRGEPPRARGEGTGPRPLSRAAGSGGTGGRARRDGRTSARRA
jgi:hypothetical protein